MTHDIHVHIHNHNVNTGEIMATLAELQTKQDQVISTITAENTVIDSILALVQGDSALIAQLRQELADAIAANNPAAIQAVITSMDNAITTMNAKKDAIAAAVVAGTQP